jgi:hypothetical protein
MKTKQLALLTLFLSALLTIGQAGNSQPNNLLPYRTTIPSPRQPAKIQVAVLLDVSNSMDGLIDQAKAQLWNMVNTLGKVKCGNYVPQIEVALYEYGRSTNASSRGYVKQLSDLSTDLDKLSGILFGLTTDGGDEYCGQVIYSSLTELAWDPNPGSYKVIFICGNEDFLQGNMKYQTACNLAKQKGVVVNTIYCGDRMDGIREHWNINDFCGGGSYTNINQNAKLEEIPTPYDQQILTLNEKLNGTYIGYTNEWSKKAQAQKEMDQKNLSYSTTAGVKRSVAKAKSNVYNNSSWDLVDKADKDGEFINNMDTTQVGADLKGKSKTEIKKIVAQKSKERGLVQKQIAELSVRRDAYITTEKAKKSKTGTPQTLETEMEKIIRKQIALFNMTIK